MCVVTENSIRLGHDPRVQLVLADSGVSCYYTPLKGSHLVAVTGLEAWLAN